MQSKHAILQHFNPTNDSSWYEIVPSRAAKLFLRGASGALDLYICYLPTSSQKKEEKITQKVHKNQDKLDLSVFDIKPTDKKPSHKKIIVTQPLVYKPILSHPREDSTVEGLSEEPCVMRAH